MSQIRFRESDRVRIRSHLGYLSVEPASAIQLGFPSAQQAQFLVEIAMDRIIPEAIPRALRCVEELDCIENQMSESRTRLKAQQLGELKLRNNNDERTEADLLEREYRRWAVRLADLLGVPLNVYSERFREGGSSMSVPVAG